MSQLDLLSAPSPRPDLLADLNAPQREAVTHSQGPLLVLAGAGSGKTRALVRKIVWLIEVERIPAFQILAVTFTNKAAAEMRERAAHLLGERAEQLWLGTFHSIGVRILRAHGHLLGLPRGFVIHDADDQETMLKRVIKSMGLDEKAFPPKQARSFIERQKQLCYGPEHPSIPRGSLLDKRWAEIYRLYQKAMSEANAVDFNDLIWLPYRLVSEFPEVRINLQSRFRHILVDEFQDTNRAQHMLLRALLGPERNLCAVGDDDQSIYGWRGAEVQNILSFEKDFPGAKMIRFEQNYRSSHPILAVSGALIAQNQGRHGKTLFTTRQGGEPVRVFLAPSDLDEADWVASRISQLRGSVPLNEFAIIYRTNAQSRVFEDRLRARGIPHRVYGGLRFYDRAEIKDIVSYLKLLVNPSDPVALSRVINKPTRGIGDTTVGKIEARAQLDGCTMWEALLRESRESGATATKLTGFAALIQELMALASHATALEVTRQVIAKTGFIAWLERDNSVEGETRAENVRELLNSVGEFCERRADNSLATFLDEIALVSTLDDGNPESAVALLTAHVAKGLEFDAVFVTGVEEDLMPHFNSIDDPSKVEEERRLAYVALTRARHHLHISHAETRRRFGQIKPSLPSRFLDALPREYLREEGGAVRKRPVGHPGLGSWGNTSSATTKPVMRKPAREDYAHPEVDWAAESQVRSHVAKAKPPAAAPGEWYKGAPAFHPQFGEGVVQLVEGAGPTAKVSVRFWDGSTRKLIAKVLSEPG